MKKFASTAAIMAGIIALTACSSVPHPHATAPVTEPTLRLTLIPQTASVKDKATIIDVKLNIIRTRDIVLKEDLTQPLQLLVIDPTFTDFSLITPQETKIPGLYNFTFAGKSPDGYRVWADIKPGIAISKKQLEEFPLADLGVRKPAAINKTQMLETTVGGNHFVLSFDKAPTASDESLATLKITDKDGNSIHATGEIIGFYDDFRSVFRMSLDDSLTFYLTPKQPGFIKLFARLQISGKTVTVPFGVKIMEAK